MTETDYDKDTFLSHSILNYLYSIYQGEYSSLNASIQLGAPDASQQALTATGAQLEKIFEWYQGLSKGDCLFSASWNSPQTYESQKAIEMLDGMKAPLNRAATRVKAALANTERSGSPHAEDQQVLVSSYCRLTTSAKFYNQGHIDLGQVLKRPDIAKRYEVPVQVANHDYALAHRYLAEFKALGSGEPSQGLLENLRLNCARVPGGLRSQVHDINQMLAQYSNEFTFEMADFLRAEAQVWEAANFGPDVAGYWRAYDFSPEEAIEWGAAGLSTPGVAALWKIYGFDPKTANEWSKEGFTPALAKKWADGQYPLNEALSYIKRGFSDPDKLPKGE